MREKRSKRRRPPGGRQEAADAMMASSSNSYSLDGSFSPKAGTSKLQSHGTSADASPDSKCPICLDRFDNVSHLDRCLHRFCFRCIQEWAKNKAECPLCKQPFYSIFHSVKAEDDFKEYVLRPTVNGSFASPDGHRFRYRTTMTRDHHVPIRTSRPSSTQRTFSPPDNGILFEGFSNQSYQRGDEIHQMMRRLASRRQASAEGRSMRQIQEQELINFRRALYRSGIRVRNIQDGGRYRDISAEFFRRNPACLHRLIPWLKRELTVLFGSHGSLVNIVQHIIMSNVTRYDMESQAFVEDLRPFLLHRTDHFIHEFVNFARCPYNIEAYDQHANYDCPAPSYEEESRSESSVITISPDEADARDPDIPSAALGVGQAAWDDETPGPSYSTLEQASAAVSTTLDISESSDDEPPSITQISQDVANSETVDNLQDQSFTADDCVIVGYVKPLAERTPELVQLSSDSESSLCEVKTEDTKKPLIKPFILSDSSELSRSSSSLYTPAKEKRSRKTRHKGKTISSKHSHSRKKEKGKRPLDISSRKDKGDLFGSYALSRWRDRSRSSDCYSRSSRNKSHNNRRRHCSRNSLKPRSPEKSRNKIRRGRKRSKSRDRSLSRRSRTVSLTSESSRERCESSSRSRNHSRGRSISHDSDNNFSTNNYRSTYQWEYTYYSRNRNRDGYEQSYKRRTCGRGHYSRPSASPEYKIQSYSEKKDTRRERGYIASKQYRRDRYRSRSRSSSQMNTSGTEHTRSDKPSGKRKYKTHHLEKQKREEISREASSAKKEGGLQEGKASLDNHTGSFKKGLIGSSSEPKQKLRKKTRSPSVEIVYEGKAAEGTKHHKKKKKKKHKKKRHREQTCSPAVSPIIITIDSDSDTPMVEDLPSNNHSSLVPENKTGIESTNSFHSQSPATSVTVSTTEVQSGERADSDSKASDLCSSNRHLDAATGILDGLHFDDSSDEQNLLPVESPPNIQDFCEEEPSAAECSLPEPDPVLDSIPPASTSEMSEIHKNFAESISECDLLNNAT